jgi:hypothetical protein
MRKYDESPAVRPQSHAPYRPAPLLWGLAAILCVVAIIVAFSASLPSDRPFSFVAVALPFVGVVGIVFVLVLFVTEETKTRDLIASIREERERRKSTESNLAYESAVEAFEAERKSDVHRDGA